MVANKNLFENCYDKYPIHYITKCSFKIHRMVQHYMTYAGYWLPQSINESQGAMVKTRFKLKFDHKNITECFVTTR